MARTTDPQKFYWIDRNQKQILMMNMSADYLQKAHTHICMREIDLFNKLNNFSELRDQLEQVAEIRKVKLQYPDERFPEGNWGPYFCHIRKTHAIVPEPVARLSAQKVINERVLEERASQSDQPSYKDEESE